ncbi:N-formylglutamate amidohydrolase [Candidatus Woesearchaeota archaeon]|nr:N-formylglutamate amidohydrolase [Candidatus Woesearchaeota archaeon]
MVIDKKLFEKISPILIKPSKDASISIGLSKRFFLFEALNNIINVIEEDPYLNFVALLKNYKVLGKFLNGTLREFHRDRNKAYFKNFFLDKNLWQLIKEDLESLYPEYKKLKVTITKRGVIVYDNYKKNAFNTLLLTVHSGTWVPKTIEKKFAFKKSLRRREEDIDTNKIYRGLVLEKAGIWIDSKQSRFVIDFNRDLDRSIYQDQSEKWLKKVWREELTKKEKAEVVMSYTEFYFTLQKLLDAYQFNIIFDGHSMKNIEGRPKISFGTKYIPRFYMPIVISMVRKLSLMGYTPVALNKPYSGGYILEWFSKQYPNVFTCSMEINKSLYMNKTMSKIKKRSLKRLRSDLPKIFDIELEE